ncbi:hypothetical protein TNCV_1368921 [Trichonephila clavipes]|nr:hypothetical protein TNCV_1368921 [Trichonephila clavipes]
MTPPPQDTLVSRKLMTGFARDFTGRECTEMSFGMSCIVGSAKGENPFLNDHLDVEEWILVPIPPAIAPFHRIGIDLLGRFPKSAHGNKWISLHGLLNAICNNKKPCRQPRSTK